MSQHTSNALPHPWAAAPSGSARTIVPSCPRSVGATKCFDQALGDPQGSYREGLLDRLSIARADLEYWDSVSSGMT